MFHQKNKNYKEKLRKTDSVQFIALLGTKQIFDPTLLFTKWRNKSVIKNCLSLLLNYHKKYVVTQKQYFLLGPSFAKSPHAENQL